MLAILLGGCAARTTEKQYANAGYDNGDNYDLSLCWKKFIHRRATDNHVLPNEKYVVRDVPGKVVGSGVTSVKGETIPLRCDPRGPFTSELVFERSPSSR
ncbi:hypothetical protein AX767_12460 [Variovorax sp. PAMC 28711]|nr:hypothetical protein AX767_12460 [Variovorax sp. PAMC 28711]